jgi:hypothetical protein
MHLKLEHDHPHGDDGWGTVVVKRLLPWASAGGDEDTAAYAARIGLELDPGRLRALALYYWLDRAAYQLSTYPQRREQPAWLRGNVDGVLRHVEAFR